ncbi:MAG: hypothetical protein HY986_14105 [Candidatus Melainabacteria bacterium]|nr:hypothetical protein [Candidatus Melainabacteria bacterium]
MISACGNLFVIDSNADGMTALERAQIVQRNLDHALVSASDLGPDAVRVRIQNRNPIVTLDDYHIVTADGNSATRNHMTQMQLAEKWADSIRICLADSASIGRYLSLLTGKYPLKQVRMQNTLLRDEIAVATSEMLFPIALTTPISTSTAVVGDQVEAVITHDVPMRTSFASYMPAGTRIFGEIVDAKEYTSNNFCGKDGFSVNFHEMRTPDGKRIPIEAHVYGGVNSWRQINIKPVFANCCEQGTTLKSDSLVTVRVTPAKGHIVGAWKGASVDDQLTPDNHFPRLIFRREPIAITVPVGEPMLMQLSATTVIAVSGRTL